MKKYFLISAAIIAVASLLPSTVVAGKNVDNGAIIKRIDTGGYSAAGTERLYTRIQLSKSFNNTENCGASSPQKVSTVVIYSGKIDNPDSADDVQTQYYYQQYASALTAFANGTPVGLWVQGCTEDNRYTRASRLTLKK